MTPNTRQILTMTLVVSKESAELNCLSNRPGTEGAGGRGGGRIGWADGGRRGRGKGRKGDVEEEARRWRRDTYRFDDFVSFELIY